VLREDPALIRRVHEDYLSAGADVIVSASYQASPPGFARVGIGTGEALALIRLSVELAQEARRRQERERPRDRPAPLVAGSVGPWGAACADGSEYRGGYGLGDDELAEFHRPRLDALVAAGVDLLAVETIPSVQEARVIAGLLAEWPAVPAWITWSCRDEGHVSEGQPIEEAVAAVEASRQVVALGVNCVAPGQVDGLLARMRRATSRPLVAYPNSGERWDVTARRWLPGGPMFRPADDVPRWHARGAMLLGGCCRTTPDTIREIRRALDRRAV
jgi:homocysteine S-methyltransferase